MASFRTNLHTMSSVLARYLTFTTASEADADYHIKPSLSWE